MGERASLVRRPEAAPPRGPGVRARPPSPRRARASGSELGAVARRRALPWQAKLEVGSVDDPLEHEADRLARDVMRTPGPGPAAARCACGGTPGPDGECAACRARRLARVASSASAPPLREAPPSVHAALAGPGRALDQPTRAFFEPRLGLPLADVRIHDDARAAASTQDVAARAYTVGRDIVFGAAQYAPGTTAGRTLLAHELAHVVQQGAGRAPARPLVRRQSCAHDGKGSANCGWYWKFNEAPEENSGVDARIVRLGLPQNLGGTWVSEVSTPENTVKRESKAKRGRVDGLKVTQTGATLGLEVVEIKSRATGQNGGCALATAEAKEYVRVLQLIAPRIAAISRVAAARGGIPPRDSLRAEDRRALIAGGIDPMGADRAAWRFYNSLQARLGQTFTQGFDAVTFARNQDGTPGATYSTAGPTITFDCKTRGRRPAVGTIKLQFQVNGEGGISYNCVKDCPDDDEEERRRQPEQRLEKAKERGKRKAAEPGQRPAVRVPPHPSQPPPPPPRRERVHEIGVHPYFEDYANRLPYLEAPPGSDFVVVIDDLVFRQRVEESERLRLERTRSLMRPIDVHTSPVVQATAPFVAIAPYLVPIAIALGLAVVVMVPFAIAEAIPVAAGLAETAVVAEAGAEVAAAPAIVSTIEAPAAIAEAVAPSAAPLAGGAAALPAVSTAGGWVSTTLGTRAGLVMVAALVAQGLSQSDAEAAVRPYASRRVLALADVRTTPGLANSKPGQEITIGGQSFRAIIRLATRP